LKTSYAETKEAIAKIKAMNIHVVMPTGDNERTANEAGIEEYHADLLSEDKVSIIEEIVRKQKEEGERKKKQSVIMVGDGICRWTGFHSGICRFNKSIIGCHYSCKL